MLPQKLIDLIRGSKPEEVNEKVAGYIRDNEAELGPAVCSLVATTLEIPSKSGSAVAAIM